jgi:hypothetical protein
VSDPEELSWEELRRLVRLAVLKWKRTEQDFAIMDAYQRRFGEREFAYQVRDMPEWATPEEVQRILEGHRWRWASSASFQSLFMRHEYSLKQWWDHDEFERIVFYIHRHGTERRFGKRSFPELTLGSNFYWCVGSGDRQRLAIFESLINRKPISDRRPRKVPAPGPEPEPSLKLPQQLRLWVYRLRLALGL